MRQVRHKPVRGRAYFEQDGTLTLEGQELLLETFQALREARAEIESLTARVAALEAP